MHSTIYVYYKKIKFINNLISKRSKKYIQELLFVRIKFGGSYETRESSRERLKNNLSQIINDISVLFLS